jgi:hypothetical protein
MSDKSIAVAFFSSKQTEVVLLYFLFQPIECLMMVRTLYSYCFV